jgi:flavin reductase (DIM6/NTAB) family NADH-FMN oxidoreductase RutF
MSEAAKEMQVDGPFVEIDPVDNFYQASSFIPMSFALVTTVHETGETGIGPHALLYPFGITKPYSMMLISRPSSGTAANIRRTGKCALNYVPFDRECLQGIANLGYPGMPLEDKIEANPYTMIDSPSPERAADADFPDIIDEAFQVFECTWDDRFDLQSKTDAFGRHYDSHFNLMIDSILVREKYAPGIEEGEIFPNTPIFYGFRANRGFWLAKHEAPFSIPLPKVEGMTAQSVTYLANRINSNVCFTDEACKQLAGIPEPFMKDALKGIVAHALADGVTDVDEAYLAKVNAERE